jgi:hypothetical protein
LSMRSVDVDCDDGGDEEVRVQRRWWLLCGTSFGFDSSDYRFRFRFRELIDRSRGGDIPTHRWSTTRCSIDGTISRSCSTGPEYRSIRPRHRVLQVLRRVLV